MSIRDELYNALFSEIVGPSPNPNYLDPVTGEEILVSSVHGSPKSRYGAGILYPKHTQNPGELDSERDEEIGNDEETSYEGQSISEDKSRSINMSENGVSDEEPVSLANQFLPSVRGFTVRLKKEESNDLITINIESSLYEKRNEKYVKKGIDKDNSIYEVQSKGKPFSSDAWVRKPLKISPIQINAYTLLGKGKKQYSNIVAKNKEGEDVLKLQIFNRSTPQDDSEGYLTYTFSIINELKGTTDNSSNSSKILFQNKISIQTENHKLITPYRERISITDTEDEKEMNLLYRKKRVFGIGHGVAVSWNDEDGNVTKIETSVIPRYELAQVAPTSFVELSMLELSDLGDWNKALSSIEKLVSEYRKWIKEDLEEKRNSKELFPYKEAADRNISKCKLSLERIERGFKILKSEPIDSDIVKCFRWMNHAMIWQQQRSKVPQRKWIKTGKGKTSKLVLQGINNIDEDLTFKSLYEYSKESQYNGRWRPFQLAFVLLNLNSVINPDSSERKILDLIWFPTGGGKTEAYLGLSAFTIFYRRIRGAKDWNWDFYGGTSILMRYTLRLLTTQQYERASSLICGCELIRRKNEDSLGDEPITIGLWVGGSSSPNKNKEAVDQLNALKNEVKEPYQFVVMKCPCCGAQIGKIEGVTRNDKRKIIGIRKEDGKNGKVYFSCENEKCEFYDEEIPLTVIDENIYNNPPTLLLGTVDKFAIIPWKEAAGNIFGFRNKNKVIYRICPPELIIQDELHLIAGPLGTMVGLYETMVQILCNNYDRTEPPFIEKDIEFIPPKIIASSATISRAYEQVKNLYGINKREQLNIFPAQGLEYGNTWFSEEKPVHQLSEEGKQLFPGRMYIGLLASGYPSAQTAIVRAYSSILQKTKELDKSTSSDKLDFYWTLLGYFNSIRELGGASSLVYGDIKERLSQIQGRELIPYTDRRRISQIEELTSRRSSDEIPTILKRIEESLSNGKNRVIDVCLATNMVATGVDISRLGLMFIHGQPKTTAEYIQASSRVGRDTRNGPGIIVTLYSPSKPRDKSQYEQFQGYHSRIYSNVEPTSVTPYSINARERGLHAVIVGLIRHFAEGELRRNAKSDSSEFEVLVKLFKSLILKRCNDIDPLEEENTKNLITNRIDFWKQGFDEYGDAANKKILQNDGFIPLLYSSSAETRGDIIQNKSSLPTPTSMRGVDTESVLEIIKVQSDE